MQVKDIISTIEDFAPLSYQESYDNSGLQIGDIQMEVTGVLIALDVTEALLDEAKERNCNMIVTHHPLIFSGLKRLSGKSYIERIVYKAIKEDIAIYACHTNLDNMQNGVNAKIAEKLGLQDVAVLAPMSDVLYKLFTYVPLESVEKLRNALFEAGAGAIGNYDECSFNTDGIGTFKPGSGAKPYIGDTNGARQHVKEVKLEVLVPKHQQQQILQALKNNHPYEEVAYELIALKNVNQGVGAGMIGTLASSMEETAFLHFLKEKMQTDCVRHTALLGKKIMKVAVCGGSGSFLLKNAINNGADIFITGDFKYHQFFDADNKIIVADIGHYESEQFTKELLSDILYEKFPNFAVLLSNISTNPVNYFC